MLQYYYTIYKKDKNMLQIGIADINKKPSIIDNLDDIAQIVNKKTKVIKGYFIPFEYSDMIKDTIEEIEYQKFKQRNKNMISSSQADDSLLDGLDEEY